jgi:5-methylcytosine-specific restriction endonuclease McrA
MSNSQQTSPTSHHPRAGYYPDHERVIKLNHLADNITELVAHLDAGTFQLLQMICEFDADQGWSGPGIASCAHWLNWKCGMSMGSARERVRVARALPELPAISAAFCKGQVSYSKVRAMTRVATPKNEAALLQVALHGTASHVETQVRLYRKTKRIEALEEENLRHGHRALSWYIDDDGYWVFKGRFTAEQGAVLQKALEAAGDQLFEEQQNVPGDVAGEIDRNTPLDRTTPEPISQKRADELARVVEGFLAGALGNQPGRDQSGGDKYMVNIHTNIETLKEDGSGAEAELEDRCHIPAETSRRLACDCSIVHWHENEQGDPLNIGRKTRSIPPAIRRALKRRDQGCCFPGCTCRRFVDAHHIQHWADGGETSMANLVLLCRVHHRLVHEAGYGVRFEAGEGAVFSLPDGKTIPQGPDTRSRGKEVRPGYPGREAGLGHVLTLQASNRKNGLKITPGTAIPQWHGEQMDHGVAVDMLLQCD